MGAFALKIGPTPDSLGENKGSRLNLKRALTGFERQGFGMPLARQVGHYNLALYGKRCGGASAFFENSRGEFCAITGTLILWGRIGVDAARIILDKFEGSPGLFSDAIGSFSVVISKGGKLWIWTDRNGTYKVYYDAGLSLISSSFLALLEAGASNRLESQQVYEYVFQGATYGRKTICDNVYLLEPGYMVCAGVDGASLVKRDDDLVELLERDEQRNRIVSVPEVASQLKRIFSEVVRVFNGKVDTALSGGYDSRLMLAVLLSIGERPYVHVYGSESSDDVRIANEIGARVGLKVEHIDKSSLESHLASEDTAGVVEKNFYSFDGLPADGIFDLGSDLASRLKRAAGGRVALNGGGGEIFRNFFYLPDRPLRVRSFLQSFYNRFDPSWCTPSFDEEEFHRSLESKIKTTLHLEGDRLSRRQIELLYPAFRCRYWMGKNNAVNNRFGHALTPLVEPGLIQLALRIPLSSKNSGRFEADLVSFFSKELAACNSSYGHNFLEPPGLKRRASDALNMARPIWARRVAYRVKARLQKQNNPLCTLAETLAPGIDLRFPVMSTYLRTERVMDPGVVARMGAIEYLADRYGLY